MHSCVKCFIIPQADLTWLIILYGYTMSTYKGKFKSGIS